MIRQSVPVISTNGVLIRRVCQVRGLGLYWRVESPHLHRWFLCSLQRHFLPPLDPSQVSVADFPDETVAAAEEPNEVEAAASADGTEQGQGPNAENA